MDDDKNIQRLRLLGFSLFRIQETAIKVLLKLWEILVKGFWLLFRNS